MCLSLLSQPQKFNNLPKYLRSLKNSLAAVRADLNQMLIRRRPLRPRQISSLNLSRPEMMKLPMRVLRAEAWESRGGIEVIWMDSARSLRERRWLLESTMRVLYRGYCWRESTPGALGQPEFFPWIDTIWLSCPNQLKLKISRDKRKAKRRSYHLSKQARASR